MKQRWQQGQTVTLLLVFTAVGIVLTTAAIGLAINNAHGNMIIHEGALAMQMAESGVENALMSLLRNPSYGGGTLSIGDQTATITVTGTSSKLIRSVGEVGGYRRILEITASYNADGILVPIAWNEVFE